MCSHIRQSRGIRLAAFTVGLFAGCGEPFSRSDTTTSGLLDIAETESSGLADGTDDIVSPVEIIPLADTDGLSDQEDGQNDEVGGGEVADSACGRVDIVGPPTTGFRAGFPFRLSYTADLVLGATAQVWYVSIDGSEFKQDGMLPNPFEATVVFTPRVAGTYRFRVDVYDPSGRPCVSVPYELVVEPLEPLSFPIAQSDRLGGFRIELTWDTPGDLVQSDEGGDGTSFSAGADLDLHLLHPMANGEVFEWTYDCYWDNRHPQWGGLDHDDDPSLVRDDSDGSGPEVIELLRPEALSYTVAVHSWNEWGYGPSAATVRVLAVDRIADANAILLATVTAPYIASDDLWEVLTIEWQRGLLTLLTDPGGIARINKCYRTPEACASE